MLVNIQEQRETLSLQEAQENLKQKQRAYRQAWDRGEDPGIKEFEQGFPLLKEQENLFLNWFGLYRELSFLKELMLKDSLKELSFLDHQSALAWGQKKEKVFFPQLKKQDFEYALELLARRNQQKFNNINPFASFTTQIFQKKVRITLTHRSLSPNNHHQIFIRFIQDDIFKLSDFVQDSSFFKSILTSKANVLIAGSTGSGKTSFMRTLLSQLPEKEHIITLEDTYELKLNDLQTTALQSNQSVTLDQLLQNALRMTPDRLIVGEIRGKEAITALLALNTGHKGFMSSIHANSAKDALLRMSLLFELYSKSQMKNQEILKLITQSIDYVIFLEHQKVQEVIKPIGQEEGHLYFETIAF